MKFTRFFVLFVSIGYVLSSCKKDEEPVRINLGSSDVRLWAGQDTVISVSGASGQYTVSSENEDIALAVIQDGKIHISTDLPGSTVIHVDDGAGRKAEIKLNAATFSGAWKRAEGSNDPLKAKAFIESSDPVFADELRNQLLGAFHEQFRRGYMLTFNPQKAFIEMKWDGTKREGSFSFRNLMLTLVHNAVEEVYKVTPISLQTVSFEQDLTAHYKALYPDKGITKVVVVRPMRLAFFPG